MALQRHPQFFTSGRHPGLPPPTQSSQLRRLDAHSGVGHLGFSCWRQCRCAASNLERIDPHSGHSTVSRRGLALHDVVVCRSRSCLREKVLWQ